MPNIRQLMMGAAGSGGGGYTLWAWGDNSNGRGHLGLGDEIDRSSPVQVGSDVDWAQIASSSKHTHAIKTDGTLWGWGAANDGKLGMGALTSHSSPVQVGALTDWSQVAAASSDSAAIKTDGTLWTWGSNNHGQLGQGNVIYISSPVQVGALTDWSQVAGFAKNFAAIKTDGTLWTWGRNNKGQLGLGTPTAQNESSPVQVGALTNWATVSVGQEHVIATKTDGTLWFFGGDGNGKGGQGTNQVHASSPVQVGALTDWSTAVAHQRFTAATKTDGTLWTWGDDMHGGLGNEQDAGTYGRSSPVQVGALTNWSAVIQSGYAADGGLALKTDGTLWVWGEGASGRLGNSSIVNTSSPIQVGSLTTWGGAGGGGLATFGLQT